MVTLNFRKILEYDPTFNGKFSKYEGYNVTTLQQENPDILLNQKNILDIPQNITLPVFSSPLIRAMGTASKYYHANNIITLEDLSEIKFSLHSLLSESEYKNSGSTLVRERFVEAFISDSLIEKRLEIKSRMDILLNKFSLFKEGNYLLISHSFFMKVFQVYLENKNLFEDPSILKTRINPTRRLFEFGKGFEFSLH